MSTFDRDALADTFRRAWEEAHVRGAVGHRVEAGIAVVLPVIVDAALAPIEALHYPVEIEPSDTICGPCSFQLPNGRFFGKVVEWPCPTGRAVAEIKAASR